jgi:hypothetical protein
VAWVIDIDQKKAKQPALIYRCDRKSFGPAALFGIEHSNGGLISFPGGFDQDQEGRVIGGSELGHGRKWSCVAARLFKLNS